MKMLLWTLALSWLSVVSALTPSILKNGAVVALARRQSPYTVYTIDQPVASFLDCAIQVEMLTVDS